MTLLRPFRSLFILALAVSTFAIIANAQIKPGRDPNQPIDQEYTNKIREYTTAPYFNSPLTDYLPASSDIPTPKAVLGDVAGAPGKLPYAEEVYKYMRMLERASPNRVKPTSSAWLVNAYGSKSATSCGIRLAAASCDVR